MKVFCKYCHFYDPEGWIGGNIELGELSPALIPAECDYGKAVRMVAVRPPVWHREHGRQTKRLIESEVTLDSNKNFDCMYYHKKWWIRQKTINKMMRL